jgi:hypothetical protein
MLSDPRASATGAGGRRWAWLSSQGLGVLCGQATVILLAIGSVVFAATRDGASARIAMDDIRGFFDPASVIHLWFYLLVAVLTLYALNTTLATWQNVVRKWRDGVRAPRFYAPAVIHLAFLTGLLAHGVGGLWGGELGRVLVGPAWKDLGDGRQARVVSLDVESHPDGAMKQIHARVETRGAAGAVTPALVRYNGPLSWALGSDLLLLIRPHAVPAVRLARGEHRCDLEVEGGCDLGGLRVELLYLHPPLRAGQGAFAQLRAQGADAGEPEVFSLTPGQPRALADGSLLSVEAIEARPAILLRRRHAPGNPWALLASAFLVLGLAMMWRRFGPLGVAT